MAATLDLSPRSDGVRLPVHVRSRRSRAAIFGVTKLALVVAGVTGRRRGVEVAGLSMEDAPPRVATSGGAA